MSKFTLDQIDLGDVQIKKSNYLLVVCSSESNNIFLVDPKTSFILKTYADENAMGIIQVSQKFGHLIACHQNKTLFSLFNFEQPKSIGKASINEKLNSTDLIENENYSIAISNTGYLYIWNTISGFLLHKIKTYHKSGTYIKSIQDFGIIIGYDDGTIQIFLLSQILDQNAEWRTESEFQNNLSLRPNLIFHQHQKKITQLSTNRMTNDMVISTSLDKKVIVWDSFKGNKIYQQTFDHETYCSDLNDQFFFVGSHNNIYYLNLSQKEFKETLQGHQEQVLSLVKNHEYNYLISGDKSGVVMFWNDQNQNFKKINPCKTPITQLFVIKRPKELQQEIIHKKKAIIFKTFKKFDEQKFNLQKLLQKETIENEQIKNQKKVKKVIQKQKSLCKLLQKNKVTNQPSSQGLISDKQIQQMVKDCELENQKLRNLNNYLQSF